MLRIMHIVNPVEVGPQSDLFLAQPVTFASMERARENMDDDVQVSFHAACYLEDESLIPSFFDSKTILTHSVLDEKQFLKPRKLPLIQDIISSVKGEDYDYLIYTNVDIAVMPWFYSTIADRIHEGVEAFIINRRTISTDFSSPDDLRKMFAQAGDIHPGLDCFIMKRELVEQLYLGKTCIGATFVGKVLKTNLISLTDRFKLYEKDHLTFHLGDDRSWNSPELDDYATYNKQEFYQVLMHFLKISRSTGRERAEEHVKDYLYKCHDWNEDGQNPYLERTVKNRTPFNERLKRSIGALLGKT